MKTSLETIDCNYILPEFAAVFLRIERESRGNSAVVIETNTSHSVPLILAALQKNEMTPEQVQYVIVTHAHLDHSAGASALLQACPNAILLAHPKAAPHLIDPSRLVASARAVYGDEAFDRLYGKVDPIPASRVRAVGEGEIIELGLTQGASASKLHFLDARGHAPHHLCIYDSALQGVYTGDTFGLAYPAIQKRGLLIFPSTSPTGFEPEEAKKSIDRILETGASRAFLTHFGELTGLREAADQLKGDLGFSGSLMHEAAASTLEDSQLDADCEKKLFRYFQGRLEKQGLAGDSQVWKMMELDLKLNAAGIAFAAKRLRSASKEKGRS